MGLNTEIWLGDIVGGLYPSNGFAVHSADDSQFADSTSVVHIPNAGAPSGVEKNRTQKPAQVQQRTDSELTYRMDEFTTNPIYIPNIDTVELSYDKRQSVLMEDRQRLMQLAHENLIWRWAEGVKAENILRTTGKAIDAHTHASATGKRKLLASGDVMRVATAFDQQMIPEEGRYGLLDSMMYNAFLESLVEADKRAFLGTANATQGILGELYGIKFLKRGRVMRLKADGSTLIDLDDSGEATEVAGALFWQQGCVSRAIGEVKMYGNEGDPTYYGDIYSFLVRTGGARRRADGKGVIILSEATA